MDSFTQIVLGASVAELVIGRAVGRRAAVYGAVLGTLPDLDVLISYGGPVEDFTYHRGFTHSLLVLSVAAPVLGWLIQRFETGASAARWIGAVWLVFVTHVLLDAATVYGTQLFWPVTEYPVSGSAIFIIDPTYTVWLVLGVAAVIFMNRERWTGYRANAAGLLLSTAYLGWAFAAKAHVSDVAARSLEAQGIVYERLLSTPAPFNTVLWRFVAMQEDGYLEGYYSLLDGSARVQFERYESRTDLMPALADNWAARRLAWFSHGFYKVSLDAAGVVISDLRMGVEGAYVFRFRVARAMAADTAEPTNERLPAVRDMGRLAQVWNRIWDETVSLAP